MILLINDVCWNFFCFFFYFLVLISIRYADFFAVFLLLLLRFYKILFLAVVIGCCEKRRKEKKLKKKMIDFWPSCLFILFKYRENAKKLVLWVEFATGGTFSISDFHFVFGCWEEKRKLWIDLIWMCCVIGWIESVCYRWNLSCCVVLFWSALESGCRFQFRLDLVFYVIVIQFLVKARSLRLIRKLYGSIVTVFLEDSSMFYWRFHPDRFFSILKNAVWLLRKEKKIKTKL